MWGAGVRPLPVLYLMYQGIGGRRGIQVSLTDPIKYFRRGGRRLIRAGKELRDRIRRKIHTTGYCGRHVLGGSLRLSWSTRKRHCSPLYRPCNKFLEMLLTRALKTPTQSRYYRRVGEKSALRPVRNRCKVARPLRQAQKRRPYKHVCTDATFRKGEMRG